MPAPHTTTPFTWTLSAPNGEPIDCQIEVDYTFDLDEGNLPIILECRVLESLDPDYPLEPFTPTLDRNEEAELAGWIADHLLPE